MGEAELVDQEAAMVAVATAVDAAAAEEVKAVA